MRNPIRWSALVLMAGLGLFAERVTLAQQIFSSGSTGADGALNITVPGLTNFDPSKIPNHHAGDTIFNFTTITIASGSTLRLDAQYLPGPVYWLATGDVNVAGTIDLSGTDGHPNTSNRVERIYSIPGAGGYAGGPGGSQAIGPEAGAGPGGGKAANCSGIAAQSAAFSGSQYLIPLTGGSGGGGGCLPASVPNVCGGGGAGGGALLIASSTTMTISGQITAVGGQGNGGGQCVGSNGAGGGSGGAVRLVGNAITLTSSGVVSVYPNGGNSTSGFIRIEAYQLPTGGTLMGSHTMSPPFQLAIPATGPSVIQVASVNGVPVNSTHFTFPDVSINSTQSVPVVITGQNVPVGAIPTLYIVSETGPDQVIAAPALQGSFQNSTSTVNIAYPPGGSRGVIRATWTN
jgi:hypothetical protein